jgi:adenosylcobinamide-phosphate synthase
MGALALRLGIRLGKPGVYVLNPGGKVPGSDEFSQGLASVRRVIWTSALLLALFEWCLHRA